jgi:L-lactate utilization protein LutB
MKSAYIQETIASLTRNGFDVLHVTTGTEAFEVAQRYVTDGMHIGLGGSTTLAQIGLLAWLQGHTAISLSNQYEPGITPEENYERRRQGLLSDVYITGCNAITRAGELVNVDGSGNRVAAQIFGPRKILLIASTNKIVEDIEAGFERIRTIAAPKNIDRMNEKAISLGKQAHYHADNIANKFAWINGDEPGRTTIILIDEPLGF